MEFHFYLLIFVIMFLGFFIKGVAAFGDPLIINPLLSMFLDNKVITPANLILGIPLNGYIAWKNRRDFSLKTTIPILVFIVLGVIPGVLLLKYTTSWILKAGLGVVILVIGVEMLTRDRSKEIPYRPVLMAVVCFFSGITAGLYGINLFFVAYMERTSKNREGFRGNICFVFLIETIFRFIVYIITGVITKPVLILVLAALPGMLLGFQAGLRIDKKLSDEAIRYIVISMFELGGLSILIKAVLWRM